MKTTNAMSFDSLLGHNDIRYMTIILLLNKAPQTLVEKYFDALGTDEEYEALQYVWRVAMMVEFYLEEMGE